MLTNLGCEGGRCSPHRQRRVPPEPRGGQVDAFPADPPWVRRRRPMALQPLPVQWALVSACWLVPLLGVPLLSRGWGWVLASSALLPEDGLVEPRTPTPAREPARRGRPRTAPGRQLHPAGHPGRRHGRRPGLRSSHGGSRPRWRCGPPAAGIEDTPRPAGPTEDRPGSRRNRDGSWRTQTSGQPPPAARPAGALVGQGRADPADPGLADGAAKRPPAHPAAHRLHVESSTTMVP
jgi:hypothetical protein